VAQHFDLRVRADGTATLRVLRSSRLSAQFSPSVSVARDERTGSLAAVGVGDIVATDRIGQTLALMAWYEQWPQSEGFLEQVVLDSQPREALAAAR
jgi:hypothetical protein